MNKVRKVISKYKPYKEQNRNPGQKIQGQNGKTQQRSSTTDSITQKRKKSSNSWTDYLKLTEEEKNEKK